MNKRFLLSLFGISIFLAISGLTAAVFGGIKEISWMLYLGIAAAMLSIAFSVYANIYLSRTLKNKYKQLTNRVDSKFTQAREMLDKISERKKRMLSDQNTKPGNSPEQ